MWEFGLMSAVLALVTAAMQRLGMRAVTGHDLGAGGTRACNASGGDQLGRAHIDDRQPGLSGAQADAQATTTKLGMRSVQLSSLPLRRQDHALAHGLLVEQLVGALGLVELEAVRDEFG